MRRRRPPMSLRELRYELPEDVAGAVMATLARTHCVAEEPVDVSWHMEERERQMKMGDPVVGFTSPAAFQITSFGEPCLRYLQGQGDPWSTEYVVRWPWSALHAPPLGAPADPAVPGWRASAR